MARLFVAIDFPLEVKLSLSRLYVGVQGVRWVPPGNLHLTLRFIGEVDDPTAACIADALRKIEMPRFWLTLAGVGQFGGHTLWAGVEPNPALQRLQSAVENGLQGIGPAADARPYLPHVKLGRSRRRRSFRTFLAEHFDFRAEPFEVREFSLMESQRGKRGPDYEHRADCVLLASQGSAPPRAEAPASTVSTAEGQTATRGLADPRASR